MNGKVILAFFFHEKVPDFDHPDEFILVAEPGQVQLTVRTVEDLQRVMIWLIARNCRYNSLSSGSANSCFNCAPVFVAAGVSCQQENEA